MTIDPNEGLSEKERLEAFELINKPIFKRLMDIATWHRPKGGYKTVHPHESIGSFAEEQGYLAGLEKIRTIAISMPSLEQLAMERGGEQTDPLFHKQD